MAALITRVLDLATRIATQCKSIKTLINGNTADLSGLNTTIKTNLVAALNELKTELDSVASAGGATINDASNASATQTWSINRITVKITEAMNAVLNNAPAALDTLDELAAAIGDDANFAGTITTALGNRVRHDTAAQGLTDVQKQNACANLGIGNPDTNFVTTFEAGLV
ncbi:hypothetical protein [Asticcacaulis endophyticus]|uniref:Uncharacterized protein n=1 Tax=Asticcacaulis endophyticus TaxID=1395890 RepID=A0A918Q5W2_9CAUL|nr:hypothetical protein [Asticcacaulis endophyticus]GGZ32059.1 hypothetical protein GCM10011273_17630 [Asticcacaulis endophyticus]